MHVAVIQGAITSKLITTHALCMRLRDEGHEVTVLTPPSQAASDQNLPCIGEDLATCRARGADVERNVEAFRERVAAVDADLVLVDIEAHEYIIALLGTGTALGLINVFFNLWALPNVPPVHHNVCPGAGLKGSRAGIAAGWLGWRARRAAVRLRERFEPSSQLGYARSFDLYAKSIGVDLDAHVDRYQGLLPFIYRHLQAITLNLEELEFPGGIRDGYHYVGPAPNADRSELALTRVEIETRDVLDSFASDFDDRKLVYCAFGSYFHGDDRRIWQTAAQCFRENQQWAAIFGLGGRLEPTDIGDLPDNVLAVRWAPQMHALQLAHCAVIHGGMTSVYECFEHRVPIVIYPYSEIFDQYGTAHRIGLSGTGVVGNRQHDSSDDFARHINAALHSKDIAARVGYMASRSDVYRQEKRLSAALNALMQP